MSQNNWYGMGREKNGGLPEIEVRQANQDRGEFFKLLEV